MSRKKNKSRGNQRYPLESIISLIAAILNLTATILMLIEKLTE